jgi:hypothetical protein
MGVNVMLSGIREDPSSDDDFLDSVGGSRPSLTLQCREPGAEETSWKEVFEVGIFGSLCLYRRGVGRSPRYALRHQ